MESNSKILITGATGFVARHVIPILFDKGFQIITSSTKELIQKPTFWPEKIVHLPLDFSQLNQNIDYYTYFGKPDYILHLAWAGLPQYKSVYHMTVNLPNQISFLDNLINNGANNITITGSCLEYGMISGAISADTPTDPITYYGLAKDALRKFLFLKSLKNKVIIKWLRLWYMFGEGQNENSLYSQILNAKQTPNYVLKMSGGEQTRDFLPATMMASKIVEHLFDTKNGIYNCGSGMPIKVNDFVNNLLNDLTHKIIIDRGYYPYPDYEPMEFYAKL